MRVGIKLAAGVIRSNRCKLALVSVTAVETGCKANCGWSNQVQLVQGCYNLCYSNRECKESCGWVTRSNHCHLALVSAAAVESVKKLVAV